MDNKMYMIESLSDLVDLENVEFDESSKNRNVEIYFNLKKYSEPIINRLKLQIERAKQHFEFCDIHFNIDNFKISKEDYDRIINLSKHFQSNVKMDLYSIDGNYSIEEGANALFNVDEFIRVVKDLDLSPLENLLLIHMHLSSYKYKENKKNPSKARELINVLNGDEIVCLGFSELASHLHKKLNIKSYIQFLDTYNKVDKESGKHSNNLVFIEDKKYGIRDWGYSDVTWDSLEDNEEPFLKYGYFFIPLSDKDCMKDEVITTKQVALNALYSKSDCLDVIEDILFDFRLLNKEKTGYDSLDEDQIYYHRMCERAMAEFGLLEEYEKLIEDLKNDGQFNLLKGKACRKLIRELTSEDVPVNIYKDAFGMPAESTLSFMIAENMLEPFNKSIFDLSLKGLEYYQESKEQFDNIAIEENRCYDGCDNWKKTLRDIISGKDTSYDDDIRSVYICIKCADKINSIVKDARSKPITLDTFKKALTNVYKKLGAEDKFIKYQVNKVIEENVKNSKEIFTDKAQNCFMQEFLRRKEEQKREI